MSVSAKLRVALVAGLLLGGLGGGQALAADDYVTNAKEYVDKADWKEGMKTVTVETDEYSYEPKELTFEAGKPYKLVVKNLGEKKHYFTAPEFFKAIATRKVETKDAEVKAPYFDALEVKVGGELELFFVAVKPGKYSAYCTIEDHQKQGMEGTLTIK